MIANMITGLLNRRPTPSQVIIGAKLRGKKLIRHLNRFGVDFFFYENDLRFRWSVVIASLTVVIMELLHSSHNGAGLDKYL